MGERGVRRGEIAAVVITVRIKSSVGSPAAAGINLLILGESHSIPSRIINCCIWTLLSCLYDYRDILEEYIVKFKK